MIKPVEKYIKRLNVYGKKLELYSQKSNHLGNYKLIVFFGGIILAFILNSLKQYIFLTAQIILFCAVFIFLARVQGKIIKRKNYLSAMLKINSMCKKRAEGNWTEFYDTGEEFENPEHRFSFDLDIFGKNSLFQMINMTSTYSGRNKLANMLMEPLKSRTDVKSRQESITELSKKMLFRHRLLSNSLLSNKTIVLNVSEEKSKQKNIRLLDTINNLDDIFAWTKEKNNLYSSFKFKLLITGLPILSFIFIVLSAVGIIPAIIPIGAYVIQFLMLGYKINNRNKTFEVVEKYTNTLKVYSSILKQFEKEQFQSGYIISLKNKLKGKTKESAWKQIERLSKLWELIANRYNFLHAFVNAATLWDFHCLTALERWKENSGRYVEEWFDVIGEVEALCSMAIFYHDNPDFIMPEVSEDKDSGITAKNLGHPLLKDRKCNDINIDKNMPILLITGSNMSGKSTFLRTVGISLILSYLGLPVCANEFKCPMLKVYACMRTSDNLGQNVSSFYAELLRVKMIVSAVGKNEKVFFLLDEIFKGTNSADRHTGAKILINQLDKMGAWGMVSTHDLELADIEKESNGRIINYHFKEYYKDNRIYFDYKLRKGVSDTRNAIFLMKMAGVDVTK